MAGRGRGLPPPLTLPQPSLTTTLGGDAVLEGPAASTVSRHVGTDNVTSPQLRAVACSTTPSLVPPSHPSPSPTSDLPPLHPLAGDGVGCSTLAPKGSSVCTARDLFSVQPSSSSPTPMGVGGLFSRPSSTRPLLASAAAPRRHPLPLHRGCSAPLPSCRPPSRPTPLRSLITASRRPSSPWTKSATPASLWTSPLWHVLHKVGLHSRKHALIWCRDSSSHKTSSSAPSTFVISCSDSRTKMIFSKSY